MRSRIRLRSVGLWTRFWRRRSPATSSSRRDAHDYALWQDWDRGWYGGPWLSAPFLWAESFFYRRLLEAVGYFRPGPWRGVDLFGPAKQAELSTSAVASELAALDGVGAAAPR